MPEKRFVEYYEEKQKKCDKWKDYIGIKNSIVFCSALGGVLGALVGIPVGGAICGGVMGTNAQDGLRSLVDWFVGPSGEETKKYNFYKKYEEKYLKYAKDHANNNDADINFKRSTGELLSGIQAEIGKCYDKYCKSNNDETNIDIDEIISENIKIEHPVLKNLPERTLLDEIGDACKGAIKAIGNAFFGTGNKGRVVKRVEEIAPTSMYPNMDPKDEKFMFTLYEKIKHKTNIEIFFVNKCSEEQNNENNNVNSNKLYLSKDVFQTLHRVFGKAKWEEDIMPTKDNLNLFNRTSKLLFGNPLDQKDRIKKNPSLEKKIFSLDAIPKMTWDVKKETVKGKIRTRKTLECFFADISNYIQKNQNTGLTGNTKLTREKINANILKKKYDNNFNKKSNNSNSSLNTSTTSRGSLDSYETCVS